LQLSSPKTSGVNTRGLIQQNDKELSGLIPQGDYVNTTANIAQPRTPIISNAVLGTTIFVIVEVMFFAGLMSAYTVIRAGAGLRWVPPPNVRLPVESTLINTGFLMLSGILMILAVWWFSKSKDKSRWAFLGAILLGATFVALQGQEWLKLLSLGMTIGTGVFASTFFLLIGAHGLHAISAIIAMVYIWTWMNQGRCKTDHIQAIMVYWLFIVGIWPILYRLVYF
jgi:heme/copper-type cytochrome/quinol oxidase subunit 3